MKSEIRKAYIWADFMSPLFLEASLAFRYSSARNRNSPTGLQKVQKLGFSSVQFRRSVVSNSLRTRESQHARPAERPPCPSPTPGVHSDSRPSSQRCHPVNSSSVVPFSFCPQSFPASESFPMSQLFA